MNLTQRPPWRRPDALAANPPQSDQSGCGPLPDGWEITTLGSLGRTSSGGTPPTSDARFWGGDIPWISAKDMKTTRLHDSIDHVTPLALGNGTRLVQPGAILMVVRGMSLAHSFPVAIVEKSVAFNQDLKALVPHPAVDGEFILRWLEANESRILFLATEATHGTKRIPTGDLLATQIPLPPNDEQRVIAEAFSDVDRLLVAVEALIAKKQTIKQSTMEQLLTGKCRLPGFSGKWEVGKLADFGVFRSGNGFPLTFQGCKSGDYPFFKVSDINNRGNELLLKGANHWINEDMRRALGSTIFPAGSVVFAKIGAAIFLERKRLLSQESCLDNNLMAFSLTASGASEKFFYYLFLRVELGKLVSATALPSLSGREIGAICVPLPPLDEQQAIVTVLSDMDAEITALEHRLEKVREIKQGMMQQLLTGRVRLVEPETLAGRTGSA